MDQQTQARSSGPYAANLLGSISSHQAGLQGYDVMVNTSHKSGNTSAKSIQLGSKWWQS